MELTPSDRPRPEFLRVRRRRWWNQRSLWVLAILLAVFMVLAAWAVHQIYTSDAADDPHPSGFAPRPSLPTRGYIDPDSDFADTQRVWAA